MQLDRYFVRSKCFDAVIYDHFLLVKFQTKLFFYRSRDLLCGNGSERLAVFAGFDLYFNDLVLKIFCEFFRRL